MATPNTRDELIDYCLRSLGHPVLEINVADEQIEDRVDEALQWFREHHPDGSKRFYLTHQLTQTDIDNQYITFEQPLITVIRMLPLSYTGASTGWFSDAWQFMRYTITDMLDAGGVIGDLAYYDQMQQHLSLIDMKLSGNAIIRFDRQYDRINFNLSKDKLTVGDYIVFEVYGMRNPDDGTNDDYNSLWNHKFLKNYTTLLIKKQWGQNMSKFEGMQLPGGVTISGRQIYEDANAEIDKLMEKFREEEDIGPMFFVG
jgi:hypothetical protein